MKYNETEFKNLVTKLYNGELKIKRIIKNSLVTPLNWDAEMATECFSINLLDLVLNQICMI